MAGPDLHERAWRAGAAVAMGATLAFAAGCGLVPGFRGGTASAPAQDAAVATHAVHVARPDSVNANYGPLQLADSAPEAAQLPKDVTDALRGSIEPWVFAWRAGLGTCRLDQFERTGSWPISLENLEPYDGNAEGEDLRLLYLAIPSPTVTQVADPYLDWSLVQDGEIVRAHRDGLPGVALIDLGQRVRQRLIAARAPGDRIDDALWIGEQRLVVLAAERTGKNPYRGSPVVYVLELGRGTVSRYEGPAGDFEACETVRRALERRLHARLKDLVFG